MPGTAIAGPASEIDLSIAVANQPAGQVPANSLAGFSNPLGNIFINKYWTSSYTNYFAAVDYRFPVAVTNDTARDSEVTTWVQNGMVLFRLANGTAIYFYHNGETANGTLQFGIVTGYTPGSGHPGESTSGHYVQLYNNPNLLGTVSGYNKTDTTGATFTFGVSGFTLYAKFNGVPFASLQDFRCLQEGQVALQANAAYGFRDIGITLLPDRALYSDTSNGIFDVRDLGFSTLKSTGSIDGGSNQFALSGDNPGFAVGDSVIVELGGESEGGLRGTVGVGGTWPALSYPTVDAMQADTSQTPNTFAWVAATGDVYQWINGTWAAQNPSRYYTSKAVPLALVARIIEIDGDILFLSKNAVTSASVANIYHDNLPQWKMLFGTQGNDLNALVPVGVTVKFPSGSWAFSDQLIAFARTNWTIMGFDQNDSGLLSPKGVPSLSVELVQCVDITIRDLSLTGNAQNQGFGLRVNETAIPQGAAYPGGLIFASCVNGLALNLKITDVFQDAVASSFSTNVWAYNCICILNDDLKIYVQWMFEWADSTGGGFVDCAVTSPTLTAGFEMFRSSGVSMIRPVAVNATFSVNSSGDWLIDSPVVTIMANSQGPAFSSYNPIFNINTNIRPPDPTTSQGGTLRNPTVYHLYPINDANDALTAINVNAANPNVTIEGTYPNSPGALGMIILPGWQSPSVLFGAVGVMSTGANTQVNGIRVIGSSDGRYSNINISDGAVQNCIADTITAPVQSNNVTNAQWNQLNPPL